ncbi:hypothetical protein AB0C12_34250 [Actinoplanes sp. NPDC048967]|uniref:hypothetical protein n=1 Tax=Actinoplanes sp. NPDC048967 TaxID=3155269 RepID=UPI0033F0FD2D
MPDELAPPHGHATSLGHELRLGPVAGLFVRETEGPAQTALGTLLIGLVLSLCLVPIGVGETGVAPLWVAWVTVAGLVVLIVPVGRGFFRPGRRWWLYLYEGGLASLDHRGQVRESLRWDEVGQVDWEWSPHEDGGGASLVGYRLRTFDGRVVRLPVDFTNAYGSPTLADALDAPAVQPLARRARHALSAGQPLVFGRVTLDRGGLTYARKAPLRWDEVTGWKLDDGRLLLARAAGRPRRLVIPMTQVEDGWILTRLLADRLPETKS